MKKTLAEQVRAYMEARGSDYSPSDMAGDVAKHQMELPAKARCKRQNIEQLLDSDFRTVRYLPALAAAMGTTVEVLHAGTMDDFLHNPDRKAGNILFAANTTPTLAQALEVVAGALMASDDLTVLQVRPLIARLVDEPFRAHEIVPRLESLLSSGAPTPSAETSAFAGKPPATELSAQPKKTGDFFKQ